MNQVVITAQVEAALKEDIGSGDVTASLLPADSFVHAQLLTREPMLMCGQPWVMETFRQVDPHIKVHWLFEEGTWIPTSTVLCHLFGPARSVLTAERTALNFLQVLAGTATQVRAYVQQLADLPTRLLDTRKTLPGLRYAQKYAVTCAGAMNHRMGLFDAFLIKENHIKACGSITQAVQRARACATDLCIEVEVETLLELQEALSVQPDRILLDNFSLSLLREAVQLNTPKRCELEASGGVDLTTIRAIAETGVDYISVGAMTKSLLAIDLSLLVE